MDDLFRGDAVLDRSAMAPGRRRMSIRAGWLAVIGLVNCDADRERHMPGALTGAAAGDGRQAV